MLDRPSPLPFKVVARVSGTDTVTFFAVRDDKQVALERYRLGSGDRRRTIASLWAADARLSDGVPIDAAAIEIALTDAELRAFAVLEADGEIAKASGNAATRLVNHVTNFGSLFHDAAGDAFAIVQCDDHKEIHPLRSKAFRAWAKRVFFAEERTAVSAQALQDTIGTLEGMAIHDGEEHPVHVRIAETPARPSEIYVDLCDAEWRCVEVSAAGWRVMPISSAPIYFVRRGGMLSLPTPIRGGTIDDLRELVNVPDEDMWRLIVGWLLMTFKPRGPYPILIVNGEQGSAKSTHCRMLRALIDPNDTPLRRPPREDRDLLIAAKNSRVILYDNISAIPPWLSDALCMIATGGGFATRTLYENDEETRFNSMRPICINGIDDLASRSDLLDRSVTVMLPNIEDYEEESELWVEFERRRAGIFGALMAAVSAALRYHSDVRLPQRPRMIDFARWVEAAARGVDWTPGLFLSSYCENRAQSNDAAIEASPIGPAIVGLLHARGEWTGIAAELLAELSADRHTDERTRKRKDWPETPKALVAALRRLAPNLRTAGLEIDFPDRPTGRKKRREIAIRWASSREKAVEPSAAPSACAAEPALTGPNVGGCGASAGPSAQCAANAPPKTPPGAPENADPDRAARAAHENPSLASNSAAAVGGDQDDSDERERQAIVQCEAELARESQSASGHPSGGA